MSHFLDIIIPTYNCKEEYMDRALKSIVRQKNVDFNEIGIIVVDDNSQNKIKNGFFRKYPQLNIEYYKKEVNDGVSTTRQYGVDRSSALYITFLDCDDELYGYDSLGTVINYLKSSLTECLLTGYVEEHKTDCYEHLEFDERESLHGVFIKRDNIVVNNIRFIEGLRHHEDYHYRRLLTITLNCFHIKVLTYIWHDNDESLVRKKRKYEYLVDTYNDLMTATKAVYDYIDSIRAGQSKYIVCTLFNLFIILESQFFDYDELMEDREQYEKELYELICRYNYCFNSNKKNLEKLMDSAMNIQSGSFGQKILLRYGFDEFLNLMANKYPEIVKNDKEFEMFLDIIVPYYNETYDMVKNLLDSIYRQNIVNFEEIQISLVSDNPNNVFDDELIKKDYPELEIVHYKKGTNDGPGQSRQYALDRSVARYVTFYDADDLMYEPRALYSALYCLKADNLDVLYTNFITIYKGSKTIANCKELVCLHGSFYNRNTLNKYNFRFHDKLFLFEDMYFCSIVNMCLNAMLLEYPTYIWIRRENSLSKLEEDDFNLTIKEKIEDFVISNISIINFGLEHIDLMRRKFEVENTNPDIKIPEFLFARLMYIFIVVESDIFYDKDMSRYERIIYDMYLELKSVFIGITDIDIKKYFDGQIQNVIRENHVREIKNSFFDFVKKMS
ncbi:MAG: glycosyltransferase [Acholeplasmatales bacterium]|nr:glycosyltransferase [Acholeplasmatales bacterium]